jgi:rhodanese-related sulfurtransferase
MRTAAAWAIGSGTSAILRKAVDDLRIEPDEAAKRIDAGNALLLDVVSSGAWQSLREVPKGALRIPPEEIASRWNEIPSGRAVIAFCT